MLKIAPSVLSADFGNMAQCVRDLKKWGADLVHCDVMDGVYVPNITFGMPMVKAIRRVTSLPVDVHLMIVDPEKYVGQFCDAGADIVTFHPEVCKDTRATLQVIKSKGKKCGLAVNADVDFQVAREYLSDIDLLLIMTVQAGFGGQSFINECLEKVRIASELKEKYAYKYEIEVDGGINTSNVGLCKDAGASIIVAGSAVFCASDPQTAIKEMRV